MIRRMNRMEEWDLIAGQIRLLRHYSIRILADALSCCPNDNEAMKNILVTALMLMLFASGCSKSNHKNRNCSAVNVVAPANETAALKAYLDSNHIDAVADSRGFFYKILDEGGGDHPNVCSGIVVTYSLKLTNGSEVDKGTQVPWDLSNLIVGWQEGIPFIAKGGSIMLYLPPSLGYGAKQAGPVPANSILVFNITLNSTY
jgi:FKBP-type peptidyl-prolyl cis-trans isomerase FkpA